MLSLFVFIFIASTFAKDYKAVDKLNINNYIGKWYQVYQDKFDQLFQGKGTCSSAEYSIINDNKISVFNKQLNTDNQIDSISGYAYYKDNDCCGYLTVKLDNVPSAPYWVIELGPIVNGLYDYSIVSDNKAHSLYVLTRNVDRFYKEYNTTVIDSLTQFGFDNNFNIPLVMPQDNC